LFFALTLTGWGEMLTADERAPAESKAEKPGSTSGSSAVRNEVRQGIARYHSTRAKPKQQAAAIRQLVELGEDGIAAAKELLEKDLHLTCGLQPLLYDPLLCAAAQEHCKEMQAKDYFSHESPTEGRKTPWDRARLAGTSASGENIYAGSNASIEAIKAWFLSPGHHKNMLSESARRQGLGHEGKYWTQMFGGEEKSDTNAQ
jgi:uncharacterized protein YkwD